MKTTILLLALLSFALIGCKTIPIPPFPPVTPTTTTTSTTTTTIPPGPVVGGDPAPVHPAVFSTEGCTILKSRPAGYVNNCDNSRKTLKTVLPPEYTDKVARMVYFTDSFRDSPKRGPSHEVGNRERFYGTMPVSAYPMNLWVRWDCVVDGVAKDNAFCVPNPGVRMGMSKWQRFKAMFRREE